MIAGFAERFVRVGTSTHAVRRERAKRETERRSTIGAAVTVCWVAALMTKSRACGAWRTRSSTCACSQTPMADEPQPGRRERVGPDRVPDSTLFATMSPRAASKPYEGRRPEACGGALRGFRPAFRARGIETRPEVLELTSVSIENDGPVTLVLSTDEWPTRV